MERKDVNIARKHAIEIRGETDFLADGSYDNGVDGDLQCKKLLFLTVGCINYDCNINFYEPLKRIFPNVISYNYVEKIKQIGKESTNAEIIEITRNERPDYVLFHTYQNQIELQTLDAIGTLGTKVVAWFSDDHWRFENYSKIIAKHVFCSVTTDKHSVEKYVESGLNVIRSQWASNHDYYKKLDSEFLYDVSFVGQNYGKRRENLLYLRNNGLPIAVFGRSFGKFLEFDDIIRTFNATKINLNFSGSSSNDDIKQIKGRVFEVPMCGAFLLTEYADGIEEYYEIGTEIECFESIAEAHEKISYYLKHDDKRMEIANNGYLRARREHTWVKRLKGIFDEVNRIQVCPPNISCASASLEKRPIEPVNISHAVGDKQGKRILLTTSAAPTQSPFSTAEKRLPIGIGFLISVLRNAGHKVFFIDNYLQPSDFLDTDYLWKNEIDYVGIYTNTICFRDTLRMMHKLEHLRQTNKWNGKIVVGGPHTTVAVGTIPDFVDYVVQGEGEQAILDIVQGKVTQRLVSYPRIENLDMLPMPAWDCFTELPYDWSVKFFQDKPVFTMNTSRGCPFRCEFCSVCSIWGKKYTYFSAERIVSDIEYLIKNYGTKGIYFREDNFTLNKERLRKFCNLIIEKGIKIPWACESRVSNLTRDAIELMSRAGLKGFYFGVESGSQKILDLLHKDITVEQVRKVFNWCHEFNVKAIASVIIGVPGETESDRRKTDELLRQIKPDEIWNNVFVGIPDSNLYRNALHNRLYEYIDDRGLVYLQGHNNRVKHYYHDNWNAYIPDSREKQDLTVKPKVSVLISVHNCEKYIEQALKSIYNQTYQDFEVVIVDDGSTDETPDILLNMKDSRTSIYRNSENKGLTKSLNIGLKLCKGQYVARMDADDISMPQRFEKQVEYLNNHPECVALGTWCRRIDADGRLYGHWKPPTGHQDIKIKLQQSNALAHGSVMLRKASLLQIGAYDEKYKYSQDYELWLRLAKAGRMHNLDQCLYVLRKWPGAVSEAKKKQQAEYAELARQQAVKPLTIKTQPAEPSAKLSVILTTYNRPELLRVTLEGFAEQIASKDTFEVIVVDDGSQPPVSGIVDQFRSKMNVLYLYQNNSGLAAARNAGIAAASAPIVLFSDDDDVPSPGLIQEHLRSHRQNPDERIAVLGHLDWNKDLYVTPLMHYITGPGGQYFGYDTMQTGRLYNVWKWWGGLISAKLSLLESLEGPFDSRLRFGYEDTELACRLLDRNVRVLYNAAAKSHILRPIDFSAFCKRRYMQGGALFYLASKHPDIIIQRYQLADASELYHQKYEPFLEKWTTKILQYEQSINDNPLTSTESLYKIFGECFQGYWLKGYVEQMHAVQNQTASLNQPVNAPPTLEKIQLSTGLDKHSTQNKNQPHRITFLSTNVPACDRGSSGFRNYHILKILADTEYKIDYLYFYPTPHDHKYIALFKNKVNFECLNIEPLQIVEYFRSADIHNIDNLWITDLWSVNYLKAAAALTKYLNRHYPHIKVIIDTMDFHYKKFLRKHDLSRDPEDLIISKKFLAVEKYLYPLAHHVVTVTEQEAKDITENIGSGPSLTVIPNIHPVLDQLPELSHRNHICFIGAFHVNHNVDAVEWFINEVFPIIRQHSPSTQFHILGSSAERIPQEFTAHPNVKIIGYVEDAERTVADYRLFVCPLTYGAGMKGKLGTAAAAATPIVTTTIGTEGIGLVDGENAFIADDPQQFAQKCLRLLSDDALWQRFSKKARQLFARNFSPEAARQKIFNLLNQDNRPCLLACRITQPDDEKPRVSIVTTCFNSQQFLPQCLDSIINQTMTQWQLLLIDDASSDRTTEIMKNYAARDLRIKTFHFDENKGPYVARNFAIQRAEADFIVIHDADDIMAPDKLQLLYDKITSDDRLAIVGASYRSFLDQFESLQYTDPCDLPLTHDEIAAKFTVWQHAMSHGSAIIRKTLFDTIGLYDENPFSSDVFFFAKAAEYAKHRPNIRFANISDYVTLLRIHSRSQTRMLPTFDPRSRRTRYHQYCETKLTQVRQTMQNSTDPDIEAELRNCKCADFIEKFGRLFDQWESEPLDADTLEGLGRWAVDLFNQGRFVTCINSLNGLEKMSPKIAETLKNYNLLRAMAYYALNRKDDALVNLSTEIKNHNNTAAERFRRDYFEADSKTDVRTWCLENQNLYDLRLINSADEHPTRQPAPVAAETPSPLVSIIMPAHNAEDFIEKAIQSALEQDYKNFELIIVDDGSTDNTKDIVTRFNDERIKYFHRQNSGAAAARNTALKLVAGDLIVNLDADDMLTPDFLTRHVREFQACPEADLVYCDDQLIDRCEKHIRVIRRPEYPNRKALISSLFRNGFPIVPFRTCIRKSVFDKIGLYDETLIVAEDYDMIRKFAKHNLKEHHLPAPLYLRRITPNSLSRTFTHKSAASHFKVLKRFIDTFNCDELFPNVEWNKIPSHLRNLHLKCRAAVIFLAIGQNYVKSNADAYAETAFNIACDQLSDCLEIDPQNNRVHQMLQKCQAVRQQYRSSLVQVSAQ